MRITVTRERELTPAELAELAGLSVDTPREQVTRVFLDGAAETFGLPEGSSPDAVRRGVKRMLGETGQQLADEGHPIMGGIMRLTGRFARRASVTFSYGEGKNTQVELSLKGGRNGGQAEARGKTKTTRVVHP